MLNAINPAKEKETTIPDKKIALNKDLELEETKVAPEKSALKIEKAQSHPNQLQSKITSIFKVDEQNPFIQKDVETPTGQMKTRIKPPLPKKSETKEISLQITNMI